MMGSKFVQLLVIISINLSILTAQITDRKLLRLIGRHTTHLDGSDPCGGSWEGITCKNGSVTAITLGSMKLKGELPGDIGQFTELQIVILVGCSFTGAIPNNIGDLESLIFL
ncbi:hypothetical protein L1987_54750 [Smallanthus sonchifolius]|uniref:Uncharacterized protein n=1 Tax=Smallanthus sonchifolius TaxID=185202 RepID=A0ACB9E7G7_9ASTR|nr:hypothetical protein L1987_54750 [Smallanthus sonchifolius]